MSTPPQGAGHEPYCDHNALPRVSPTGADPDTSGEPSGAWQAGPELSRRRDWSSSPYGLSEGQASAGLVPVVRSICPFGPPSEVVSLHAGAMGSRPRVRDATDPRGR